MNTMTRQTARWGAVLLLGGYGLWTLLVDGCFTWTRNASDLGTALFLFSFLCLWSAPFLLIAWFCLREQYQHVITVLAAIGTLVVFDVLLSLPKWLGVSSHLFRPVNVFATIPESLGNIAASVVFLVIPFWGAVWFFRLCQWLAGRYLHGEQSRGR